MKYKVNLKEEYSVLSFKFVDFEQASAFMRAAIESHISGEKEPKELTAEIEIIKNPTDCNP